MQASRECVRKRRRSVREIEKYNERERERECLREREREV